jgi:hypothetical protein
MDYTGYESQRSEESIFALTHLRRMIDIDLDNAGTHLTNFNKKPLPRSNHGSTRAGIF